MQHDRRHMGERRGRSLDSISERRRERLEHVLRRRQGDLHMVLENIHDPHNIAAVLRTCDAAGVGMIDLLYTQEAMPDLRRHGKMTSASARKWLDIQRFTDAASCVAALRAAGCRIYASHLSKHSVTLHELDFTRPAAVIVGNEHRGVSEEMLGQADAVFFIPMMGMVESLNVSVASAVTLYEALRQRMAAGMYDGSHADEDFVRRRLEEWGRR